MDKQKSDTSPFAVAVILVVDDDPVQRDILQIKVAKTLKPDVVLTDLRMHKMNGIELMEKLRSQGDAPEVIIMSASGLPCMIEESIGKGAFSFIQKPLDIPQVLLNINRALEITARLKYPDQRSQRLY